MEESKNLLEAGLACTRGRQRLGWGLGECRSITSCSLYYVLEEFADAGHLQQSHSRRRLARFQSCDASGLSPNILSICTSRWRAVLEV